MPRLQAHYLSLTGHTFGQINSLDDVGVSEPVYALVVGCVYCYVYMICVINYFIVAKNGTTADTLESYLEKLGNVLSIKFGLECSNKEF